MLELAVQAKLIKPCNLSFCIKLMTTFFLIVLLNFLEKSLKKKYVQRSDLKS